MIYITLNPFDKVLTRIYYCFFQAESRVSWCGAATSFLLLNIRANPYSGEMIFLAWLCSIPLWSWKALANYWLDFSTIETVAGNCDSLLLSTSLIVVRLLNRTAMFLCSIFAVIIINVLMSRRRASNLVGLLVKITWIRAKNWNEIVDVLNKWSFGPDTATDQIFVRLSLLLWLNGEVFLRNSAPFYAKTICLDPMLWGIFWTVVFAASDEERNKRLQWNLTVVDESDRCCGGIFFIKKNPKIIYIF